MDAAAREAWWNGLPAGVREEIDACVLRDAMFAAVRTVFETGQVGLHAAQLIAHDRHRVLRNRIVRTPQSPLDAEALRRRAEECAGRIVAIEAVWDGDTAHDWFVLLLALTADPDAEVCLAAVDRSTAQRYLGGDTGPLPHPSAEAATRLGRALAAALAVPFHFGSPDEPDDEAPRLRG
ncbi:hypothetical protein [Streptomyces sp. NPDC060194]|uniref:hypothetical protein n=1 Tax=Streptomyces sp. NPDC060194 TaxID=3347069 RepID=UPI00365150BA